MSRLLALDLDGTLLQRDGSIHPSDLAAVHQVTRAGVPVAIVTGRLYSGSRGAALAAGIQGPLACVDGSQIVHTEGDRELFHQAIGKDNAAHLRDVLASHGAATFLFTHEGIVHDARGEPFAPYVRTWSPDVAVVDAVAQHPHWHHERGLLAVVAVGPEPAIADAVSELSPRLGGGAALVSFRVSRFPATAALMVRARGPTKGTAITWLAEHYGCAPADVVAVGDWINDVPMFEVAGRSFAMGQAPETVKQAATDRLEASIATGGGVAEAVRIVWGA